MLIEQAIFTSTQTDRADGYQLACCSPGLAAADATELNIWGPSHDSLLERDGERSSSNFFRLASGSYCVSRSVVAGAEYSGRGEVVSTQFLVVPPELMVRFANNPFAVLRAATASGSLHVHDRLPKSLEPLSLGGRAAVVDLALLAQLARDPGPRAMATLVHAALANERLAIASHTPIDRLMAGLFSLLPAECRGDVSFSTGLKFSPSRPLHLAPAAANDRASCHALEKNGYVLLNLDEVKANGAEPLSAWPACVEQLLARGKLSILASELEKQRPLFDGSQLDDLSRQVEARLTGGASRPAVVAPRPAGASVEPAGDLAPELMKRAIGQRADGAHLRRHAILESVKNRTTKSTVEELVASLAGQPAEVLEMLERIDDLVFAGIDGDDRALTELQVLWPTVADELDAGLVEQSREQYLRCALAIWNDCVAGQIRRPERAVAAIDVLCVLFED